MRAEEFDQKFDDGEDVTGDLDLAAIRRPAREQRRVNVVWASSGLTDIHHQGLPPGRKDVHHGDHGAEAASPSVVHAGVQGGDRGAVPGR